MQGQKLKYRFTKAICWLLLLQLINISIDPPDIRLLMHSSKGQKQQPVNDLSSVYELVAEGILDTEVPDDQENSDITKTVKAVELFYCKTTAPLVTVKNLPLKHTAFYTDPFSIQFSDPHFPPPKSVC